MVQTVYCDTSSTKYHSSHSLQHDKDLHDKSCNFNNITSPAMVETVYCDTSSTKYHNSNSLHHDKDLHDGMKSTDTLISAPGRSLFIGE